MSMLWAAVMGRNYTVALPGAITVNHAGATFAGFTIARAGTFSVFDEFSTVDSGDWVAPTTGTVGDLFEVRLTYSGTAAVSGPASGAWTQVDSDVTWVWETGASVTGTLEARRYPGGATLDSTGSVSITT